MTKITFTPEQQAELDRIVKDRLARVNARVTEVQQDRDAFARESRRWESRAKENLAVIRAHEQTISKFIDRLDDVLNEDGE